MVTMKDLLKMKEVFLIKAREFMERKNKFSLF